MTRYRDDLDARQTLEALEFTVERRRAAEVADLELVLHWCMLHSAEPPVIRPGGERLREVGGDGTPGVKELSICELGIARQVHSLAARAVVADALDLRYRLPRVWAKVRRLEAEAWLARKVAVLTRGLSYEQVGIVDEALAEPIARQAPSRVIALCEAKIIEADPGAHAARLADELKRRYVGLSRIDAQGLQLVIAKVTAGAARDVETLVDSVADVLASRPEHAGARRDELRAEAFGWLGRPEDLLDLLGRAESDTGAEEHPRGRRRSRHRAVVYVHLHRSAVERGHGIARVEGLGPHLLDQLGYLLGHRELQVTPVIDLDERVDVNGYEHPERVAERIHLSCPGDAFPHASRISREVDLDHPVPFDPDGPEGQTSSHEGQPLSRTGHRAKTHLGYRCRRFATGEVLWRTPHGLHRIVDHLGTRAITDAEAEGWLSDDPQARRLARNWHRMKTGRDPDTG